ENDENQSLVKALPALERIIDQATDGLLRVGVPPSPGINALFDGGQQAEQQLYITFSNGRIYLVSAQAASEAQRGDAVERLRQLVSETEEEVPGMNGGITGEPELEYDEMIQSPKNAAVASTVSRSQVALTLVSGQ